MFMQIIQGRIDDPDTTRMTLNRWLDELAPTAEGWLGATYGITDDGTFVAAVRFESEQAARRNQARPEQAQWWREMSAHFVGDVTFHDCDNVTLLLGGGSDDAGFVQVIQGRVSDPPRVRELAERSVELVSRHRPDIIGATLAIDEDGVCTETVAFTSEAAAREAERQQMPAEVAKVVAAEEALFDDLHYLDLHHPWFASRRR